MPDSKGVPGKGLSLSSLTKNRIESLSDGIFAIVMTLIVLELKMPDDIPSYLVGVDLPLKLQAMIPQFETYGVSFFLLGLFWMRHVTQYRYVAAADRVLVWINIFFLMFVALVPFSVNFLMSYPLHELAFLIYAVNLSAIAFTLLIHWFYAVRKGLLTEDATTGVVKDIKILIVMTSLLMSSCIIVSFFDVRAGLIMLYLDPFIYLLYYQYNKWKYGHFAGLSKGRIETLCDGIFAIVMTLMILSFVVPDNIPHSQVDVLLPQKIRALLPKFENYFLSFVVLAVYWISHQVQFKYINNADRALLWINVLFLMMVSLIPFTTDLLMSYPGHQLPMILYCADLAVVGLIIYFHWKYVSVKKRSVEQNLDPVFIKRTSKLLLVGPAVFLISLAVSYFSVRAALMMIYFVPILAIIFRNYAKAKELPGKILSKIKGPNR